MYDLIPSLEEFEAAVVAGRINRSEHDNYVLFKYRKDTVYAQDWDEITLHSRGIIFDLLTKQCVVLPFKKFFNLDETGCEKSAFLNDMNYEILEKMDGSMGCIFLTRDNELHVATPGSLMSDQSQWATKWLRNHKNYEAIKKKFTSGELRSIVAEIICPLSRVVVVYDFEGMVLISAHDENGRYFDHNQLTGLSEEIGFKVCRKYAFDSIESVQTFLESVEDFEGFVIHWPNKGYRVKVKGADYCLKHRILSSIHPNRIDEAMDRAGHSSEQVFKKIEEVLVEFPEEFVVPYRGAFEELKTQFNYVTNRIDEIIKQHELSTAKELVFFMKDQEDEFYKDYFAHIMNAYNGRTKVKKLILYLWGPIREKYFKNIEEMEI